MNWRDTTYFYSEDGGLQGCGWGHLTTDNWQIALHLTDNWHLPWVVNLKKDLIVLYFLLQKPVPLFSSDNIIKCTLIWIILAAGQDA